MEGGPGAPLPTALFLSWRLEKQQRPLPQGHRDQNSPAPPDTETQEHWARSPRPCLWSSAKPVCVSTFPTNLEAYDTETWT